MGRPRANSPAPDRMVDRIEAWPFRHGNRPAMALVLPAPSPTEQPLPIVMVEDGDGLPLAGKVDPRAMMAGRIGEAPIHPAEPFPMGLVASWLDGEVAWDIHRRHFGMTGGTPPRRRAATLARTRDVVAKAMDASGFGDGFRQALLAMSAWRDLPVPEPVEIFGRDARGARLRSFALANPFVSCIGYHAAAGAAVTGPVTGRAIHPALTPARMAAFGTPAWSDPVAVHATREIMQGFEGHATFLDVVARLPSAWVPTDLPGMGALARFYTACTELVWSGADPMDLARGCKGRWPVLVDRLDTVCQGIWPMESVASDKLDGYLADPLADLTNRVVTPAVAMAVGPDDARGLGNGVARHLLYRDKSLHGCIESAKMWHDILPSIEAAMPNPTGDPSWEALFEPVPMGGVDLVPLTTSSAVREEGAAGPDTNGVPGLDHCVASYLPQARSGRVHLVSARRRLPDGGYLRLATAELRQDADGSTRLVQLQGRRNANAPPEAREAVLSLLCERPVLPRIEPRVTGSGDAVIDACGYDWTDRDAWAMACRAYAPMFARHLRDDPAAVMAEILRVSGKAS